MRKKHLYYTLLLCIVLLGTSCSTSKKIQTCAELGGMSSEELIQKVIDDVPEWSVFSAKTSVALYSESGKRAKVRGVLTVKRDEAVRLSVAPLLGIEFFRLEITPKNVLVLDRMNKRYMRCTLEELSRLVKMDVTYNVFQSLFLNELFTLDSHRALESSDRKKFKVRQYAGETVIEPTKNRSVDFKFYTNAVNGLLEKTQMGVRQYKLNWDYDDFSYIEKKNFPHQMRISAEGVPAAPSVELNMSHISIDGRWNAETQIPSRYREVKLEDVLKILLKR